MSALKSAFRARSMPGLLAGIVAGALLAAAVEIGSENITLSTYYPAPSGIYRQMITTGDAFLARDTSAKVGVGTTTPSAKLTVSGNGRVEGDLAVTGSLLLSNTIPIYKDASGALTTQGTYSTAYCGVTDTYGRFPCYYDCAGRCNFTNGAGDIGCYNRTGAPASCANTVFGRLLP